MSLSSGRFSLQSSARICNPRFAVCFVFAALFQVSYSQAFKPPLAVRPSVQVERLPAYLEPYYGQRSSAPITDDFRKVRALARAICEPLYDGTPPNLTGDVSREYTYFAAIVAALREKPTSSFALGIRWERFACEVAEPVAILQKISAIEEKRPSNQAVLSSIIKTLIELGGASAAADSGNPIGALIGAHDVLKAAKPALAAEQASIDLKALKAQYRASRIKFRETTAGFLCDAFRSTQASSQEFGYAGMSFEGTGEVTTVSGPAAAAGVQVGDTLLAVDGQRISPQKSNINDVRDLIKGPVGSPVVVSLRSRSGVERDLTIVRAELNEEESRFYYGFVTTLNGSWDCDELALVNWSGKTLHNCLIAVAFGGSGSHVNHVHFLDEWKRDAPVKALYNFQNSEFCFDNAKEDTTAISLMVLSDEGWSHDNITYNEADRQKCIDHLFGKVSITGDKIYFRKGSFFDDQPGLVISLQGQAIHPTHTIVTFGSGANAVSKTWAGRHMQNGRYYFKSPAFKHVENEPATIEFVFPYNYRKRFTVSPGSQ